MATGEPVASYSSTFINIYQRREAGMLACDCDCCGDGCGWGLEVEADGEHVAVLHLVGLAFEPLQAAACHLRIAAEVDQVVPAADLGAAEAAGEVGGARHLGGAVVMPRRRRREPGRPRRAGLGAARGLPRREERDQAE